MGEVVYWNTLSGGRVYTGIYSPGGESIPGESLPCDTGYAGSSEDSQPTTRKDIMSRYLYARSMWTSTNCFHNFIVWGYSYVSFNEQYFVLLFRPMST